MPYEKIGKNEPVCIADEVPFEIPESWEWCRIGELFFLQAGKNISSSSISEKPFANAIPCYGGNGIRGYVKSSNRSGDYPIIGRQGALCGNINRATGDFYATEHAVCVTTFSNTNVSWACVFLKALNLNQYATATAQPGLAVGTINRVLIPVPPVTEQRRITEKLYLLEPLLASYESTHDLIINQQHDFPEQLKKSILQEAVQGKLVPQTPTDEPASALLERIRAEKEHLIKSGKIKRDKHESVILRRDNSYYERVDGIERCIDDEIPFEISESWEWVRLNSISKILNGDRGKNYPSKSTLSSTGIPFISALNLDGNTVVQDENLLCMTEEQYNRLGNGKLIKNDIVVCIRGSLGKHGRYPFEKGAIASSLTILRPYYLAESIGDYIMLWLDSPAFFEQIRKYDNGTAQPNLAAKSFEQFLIPLPPHSEQHRIIAKVEMFFSKLKTL